MWKKIGWIPHFGITITLDWQELFTSNFDTVHKIFLKVFVQTLKVTWSQCCLSLFSESCSPKNGNFRYFLDFNSTFYTNGIAMKLCQSLKNTSNYLSEKVWWCHDFMMWKTAVLIRVFRITAFSQNMLMKNNNAFLIFQSRFWCSRGY